MSRDTKAPAGAAIGETEPVTSVIARSVQPGREQDYTAWQSRLIAAVEAAPHSLGTVVLAPRAGDFNTFRLIQRFQDTDSLHAWENSDVRVELSAEADRFSTAERQSATRQDAWFTTKATPAPAKARTWKTAIMTFCVTYPLTALVIPRETAWLPHTWSFYEENIITNALLSLVITYFVPHLSRYLRRWLY